MTLSWIAIGTVELCVLGFIAAAAVIALIMKPGSRNEAVTEFAAGLLSHEGVLAGSFGIELTCRDDYSTVITRIALIRRLGKPGYYAKGLRHHHRGAHNKRPWNIGRHTRHRHIQSYLPQATPALPPALHIGGIKPLRHNVIYRDSGPVDSQGACAIDC